MRTTEEAVRRLASRTERLERLVELDAPGPIIANELGLVMEALGRVCSHCATAGKVPVERLKVLPDEFFSLESVT